MSAFESCGATTQSPYDDSFCFVRGSPWRLEVQWNVSASERGAANVTVLRRNGTACFRVVACQRSNHSADGSSGSFDVVAQRTAADTSWEMVATCVDVGGSGDGADSTAVFTWGGSHYACPRFALVCSLLLQRSYDLLPLDDQAANTSNVAGGPTNVTAPRPAADPRWAGTDCSVRRRPRECKRRLPGSGT